MNRLRVLRFGSNVLDMEHVSSMSPSLAAVVSGRMTGADLSLREMCRLTGIPLATLSRRLTGNSPFSTHELELIAHVFDLTVSALVVEAEGVTAA